MSAVMVSMAVLILTFISGTLAGREGTQTSRSIGATTYSYLKCIVYDKLLKPPTIISKNPVYTVIS